MVTGSSVGGVVLPILVQQLLPKVGFGWTMPITGFFILGLLLFGNIAVTSRLPPVKKPWSLKDYLIPFSELPFLLLAIGAFFFYVGAFLPFNFIIVEAKNLGLPLSGDRLSRTHRQRGQHLRTNLPCSSRRRIRRLQHLYHLHAFLGGHQPSHMAASGICRATYRIRRSVWFCVRPDARYYPGPGGLDIGYPKTRLPGRHAVRILFIWHLVRQSDRRGHRGSPARQLHWPEDLLWSNTHNSKCIQSAFSTLSSD